MNKSPDCRHELEILIDSMRPIDNSNFLNTILQRKI